MTDHKPEPTALLTREALLTRRPRVTRRVELPELGGAVLVRQMTALERGQYEAFFRSKSGETVPERLARARHKLIVMCTVDEQGNLLFPDDDLSALDHMPASMAERISSAAQELSAVSDEDIESLAKNSGGTDG